ncbi:MAG TPA: OmpA family protein [Candidatus Edwardsbacteria bacterium]|nr:OmpA family protein [Candidatus Edwardsbacteria bacterium]
MAKKFAAIALVVLMIAGAALAQTPAAKPQTPPAAVPTAKPAAPAAKPVTATVTGKVVNESLKGLAATVTIGSLTATTNPATGEYSIANVPVSKDPVTIKIDAKGFESKTATITLSEDNAKAPLVKNFSLKAAAAPAQAPATVKKEEPKAKPAEKTPAVAPKPAAAPAAKTYSSGGGHILLGGQLGACKLIDSPWHKGGVDQSTVGFVGDVMVGYSFSQAMALRADIGLGMLGTKSQTWEIHASDFSTTVIPVSVDVLYRVLRTPAFSPYLIAGVGVMPWTQSVSFDSLKNSFSGDLKTNVVLGAGLGLQYALNKTMSVFMEGRYTYFGNKSATNGALDTNNAIVRGTVGVAMNLFSRGEQKPALATIKGKITDKALKGLDAVVSVGSFSARTAPATGDYVINNVPVTDQAYTITAAAAGYQPKTATVLLTKQNIKAPAVKNLTLDPIPVKPGTVNGLVIDYKTGATLAGRLILNGPKTQTIDVKAGGAFDLTLDPGSYDILAKADGYNDKDVKFVVKEGEAQKLSVALVKKKEVFAFENINFDVGKATIKAESTPVLEQLYKVLQDNPEIKVEIAGHTDKMGSPKKNLVLSQARAAAVVKWLMDKGIKNDRMVSQGYGDTKPVADNKTKAGRAKNRRIEINVLESAAPAPEVKKAEEPKAPAAPVAPVVPATPAKPDTSKAKTGAVVPMAPAAPAAPAAPGKTEPAKMSLPGMTQPATTVAPAPTVKPDTTKKK